MPQGLENLRNAFSKLDNKQMSNEGVHAWYELAALMPHESALVVRKRIRDQLAGEQGIQVDTETETPTFEPLIKELLTTSPERITDGFKSARKIIGKEIMDEYIRDVASHLKNISGVE